jgi:WhiB family transcriptional regulator, redox-sensing transcriptional regulator
MPNWVELGRALCREIDPELFFPIMHDDVIQTRQAKAICKGCELKQACLDYALADPKIMGIWGGTSARDRWKIRGARDKRRQAS